MKARVENLGPGGGKDQSLVAQVTADNAILSVENIKIPLGTVFDRICKWRKV